MQLQQIGLNGTATAPSGELPANSQLTIPQQNRAWLSSATTAADDEDNTILLGSSLDSEDVSERTVNAIAFNGHLLWTNLATS